MIDTTSRRDRRSARARRRLDQLINQSRPDHTASALPADQSWLDVSLDAPSSGAAEPSWWPDAGSTPPDSGAGPPDPEPDPPGEPERVLLGASRPAAEPWWRRQLKRVVERWLPAATDERPRWRLAAAATAGAVLVGVAVAAGLVMSSSGGESEVPPALPTAGSSGGVRPAGAPSSAASGGSIVISVVGRVARPGLVTLRDGARVADALDAVGGAARGAKLGALNLARRLTDGEQIYVGVPAPAGAEPPAGASGTGEPGAGPVDLNAASLTSLDTLPGVGPVTAQRIVDWRTQHGRFASVEQLREVDGIGPGRFAKLKDLVVAR